MDAEKPPALLRIPRVILSGAHALGAVGNEVRALKGSKPLVVSDPGVVQVGLTTHVQDLLDEEGLPHELFSDVEPEPSVATADNCAAFAREMDADIIVAVGGGSPIDVAKAAAVCAPTGTSIREYLGMDNVPGPGLPLICIPTTAGTGSEVSPALVLSDETTHTKIAAWSRFVLADTAIIDPIMTVTCPPKTTADSGIDALSHAVEAFVSVRANPFSDAIALEAIRLIGTNLRMAYSTGSDMNARLQMAWGATMAGIAFSCSGLGCIHALAYPFTTFYQHSHGTAIGIVMPAAMRFNSVGSEEKLSRIAQAMGVDIDGLSPRDAALKAADAVERLINDAGIVTKISAYDIPETRLPDLAQEAITPNERLLLSNPRPMGVPDALKIYKGIY